MTTTLAIANQKGGVAKTTSVASIGAAFAETGQRVLLVDLDPQACLTFSLGIDPEDLELSIYNVLTQGTEAADVVVATEDGVDLLPATIELARAEADLLTRTGREQAIKAALEDVEDAGYDWILLDCPPSLGVLTVAALTAAQGVLIPLQCETLSHRGVGQLLDTVHDVRRFTNRRLEVWGVLPTLYDGRTNHARRVLETISDTYDLEVVHMDAEGNERKGNLDADFDATGFGPGCEPGTTPRFGAGAVTTEPEETTGDKAGESKKPDAKLESKKPESKSDTKKPEGKEGEGKKGDGEEIVPPPNKPGYAPIPK